MLILCPSAEELTWVELVCEATGEPWRAEPSRARPRLMMEPSVMIVGKESGITVKGPVSHISLAESDNEQE